MFNAHEYENEERSKVSIQNPLVSPYLRAVFPPHPMCPRCDASGAAGQPIQRPGGDECAGSSTIYIIYMRRPHLVEGAQGAREC